MYANAAMALSEMPVRAVATGMVVCVVYAAAHVVVEAAAPSRIDWDRTLAFALYRHEDGDCLAGFAAIFEN